MIVRALFLCMILSPVGCASSTAPSTGTDRAVACGGPEETRSVAGGYQEEDSNRPRMLRARENDCHTRDAVEPAEPLAWPPNSHKR